MITKKEDYNNVPVYYCVRCLSLHIINMDETSYYCGDCGAASVKTSHINDWLEMKKQFNNLNK